MKLYYFETESWNKANKSQYNTVAHIDLGLDGSKLVLCSSQLCVGLAQRLTLGLHIPENLVELDDVYNPGAQTCRWIRLGSHQIWFELWVLQTNRWINNCRNEKYNIINFQSEWDKGLKVKCHIALHMQKQHTCKNKTELRPECLTCVLLYIKM